MQSAPHGASRYTAAHHSLLAAVGGTWELLGRQSAALHMLTQPWALGAHGCPVPGSCCAAAAAEDSAAAEHSANLIRHCGNSLSDAPSTHLSSHVRLSLSCGKASSQGPKLQSHLVVACICVVGSPLTLSVMRALMRLSLALHSHRLKPLDWQLLAIASVKYDGPSMLFDNWHICWAGSAQDPITH